MSKLTTKLSKEHKLPTGILALDISPDAKTAYAACIDGGVYSIALDTGKRTLLARHDSYASGVALVPNSSLLISSGYDGTLQWIDLNCGPLRKIRAHNFWSWQLAVSPDGSSVASVTGQYLCGGYKYEPLPEREPSVRVYDARTSELRHTLPHIPPVQSAAFSSDGKYFAAGNLMGEVRIWDVASGKQAAQFTTPNFTGWGIIKGHYYTGGIFALHFAHNDEHLLCAGMGSTTDPAAGNGKQLWQRFTWRDGKKLSETSDGDAGRGLMETLALHPAGDHFAMGGRLENGKWTAAIFDSKSGALQHQLDTKSRVTKAIFSPDGKKLFLGETLPQLKPEKDKPLADYGRISIHSVEIA